MLPAPLFPVELLAAEPDVPLAVLTAPAEPVVSEPDPEAVVVAAEDETGAEMGVVVVVK